MSEEDTRTSGEKSRDAKTPEQRKEAGGKASKRKKFFAEFRKIGESLGAREETNYSKIKKHFEDNVDWDWSEEYLRPQVYDATVNDMLRTSRWTKTPEPQFDVFFAMDGDRRKLVAYDKGKHGHWFFESRDGKRKVVQDATDKERFKIAGERNWNQDMDCISFEELKKRLPKIPLKRNYLPVAIRFLTDRVHAIVPGIYWGDIEHKIKSLNSFYEETDSKRTSTAKEMVVEQQERGKNFVGIRCLDENREVTSSVSKSNWCYLDVCELSKENEKELRGICGRIMLKMHFKEKLLREAKSWFVWAGGRTPRFLDEFEKNSIVGCHYGARFDASGMDEDEIRERLVQVNGDDKGAQELFNFTQIKRGDVIAVITEIDKVREFAIATSDYSFGTKNDLVPHKVDVEYLDFGTDVFGPNTQKGVMADSAERIRQFLEGMDTETVNPSSGNPIIMSTVPDCVTNSDVNADKHMEYRNSLERKNNVVFYGPPGTGKTWTAREVAECWVDKKLNNIFNVTFHPSYSYEDFIEGFRPRDSTSYSNTEYVVDPNWYQNLMVTSGTATAPAPIPFANLCTAISPKKETLPPYELVDGIFKRAVARAKEVGDDEKVVVLIDEINRGNVAKIFGELITLIENNKREKKYAVKLTYSREEFWVPKNLYIIGTMNTADTSLIQVDSALRRRFAWKELMPDLGLVTDVDMNTIMKKINEKILEEKLRDKQIGHSYFMDVKPDKFKQVFLEDVVPLLQDYFYHDYDILEKILGKKVIDIKTQTIKEDLLEKEGTDFIKEVKVSIDPPKPAPPSSADDTEGTSDPDAS